MYIIFIWLDKTFKGTVVNCHLYMEGHLKLRLYGSLHIFNPKKIDFSPKEIESLPQIPIL